MYSIIFCIVLYSRYMLYCILYSKMIRNNKQNVIIHTTFINYSKVFIKTNKINIFVVFVYLYLYTFFNIGI